MEYIKKIATKKKDAYTGMFMSIVMITTVMLFVVFTLKESSMEYTSIYVGDSLNAAVMAGLEVDLTELAYQDNLIVTEKEAAGRSVSYDNFLKALKVNLNLDDAMMSSDYGIIAVDASGNKTEGKGEIVVEEYSIYNVKNGEVYKTSVNPVTGSMGAARDIGAVGTVTVDDTNHTTINSSAIYAKISFNVDGLFAGHIRVAKESCMDVSNVSK